MCAISNRFLRMELVQTYPDKGPNSNYKKYENFDFNHRWHTFIAAKLPDEFIVCPPRGSYIRPERFQRWNLESIWSKYAYVCSKLIPTFI